MKKLFLSIIILISILFSLTSCNYTNGIDDFYFIIALGLDITDENLLKVSVQISSNSESDSSGLSSSSQSSEYKIYSAEAETFDEAITILNNFLNKQINLSHCSTLIVSEKLAKNGLQTYINTLSNNTELRHSCQIIVSSSTAYELMDNISNSGEVFSARLYDYLATTTNYTGFTVKSTFGKFFQALENDYYEPTAIYAKISDNIVQTSGVAVFKNDRMIGSLNILDSIAHLVLTNELNTCVLSIQSPFDESEIIDLDLNLYKKTLINIDVINNSPFANVSIYPEAIIRSSGENFNYTNFNNISKLEIATNNYLKSIIKNYLYLITRNFNSDICGLKGIYQSELLTKNDFEKIHWDNIFKDTFFSINVNTRINSSNLFEKK